MCCWPGSHVHVRWPYIDTDGHRHTQEHALELKVWRDRGGDPLSEGLAQLDRYLDRLGLDTGVLVVFDRRTDAASITERTHTEAVTSPSGRTIMLLRA